MHRVKGYGDEKSCAVGDACRHIPPPPTHTHTHNSLYPPTPLQRCAWVQPTPLVACARYVFAGSRTVLLLGFLLWAIHYTSTNERVP